jgi:hypothetical protein
MPQPIGSTIDMLLDVGLDALVGALILAVLIATLTAGAYFWVRRGKSDVTAILVALIFVANLASLVTGAGFIASKSRAIQLGPALHRIGRLGNSQENGQVNVPRRFAGSAARWRRASSRDRSTATRRVQGEAAAVAPD